MEDAFTGSLMLALLAVVFLAHAGMRQLRRAERSLAVSRSAGGDWACSDACLAACHEADQALACAAAVGLRATSRPVERWLVRAARRAAAAPPGDDQSRPLASPLPRFLTPFARLRALGAGI